MRTLPISLPMDAIADFCRKNHIRRMSLFGSVLRDDFTPESDVDVLVEFDPQARIGLFQYVRIQDALSEMIGRTVDLHTRESLSKYFAEEVLQEAMPIHVEA